LEQCRISLAHDTRRAEVHNTLGNVLLAQGEPEAASISFRKAVTLQPSYHLAHNNLGLALQLMGQHLEAAASYRTALEIYPDYPEGWHNRGLVLKELGHIEEATQCFRYALKLRPGYANAQASLAEMDPVWVSPLNGSTLGLRRWRAEDAGYLHACYRDAGFMNQYNHFIPREQSRNALEKKLRTVQDAHPCQTRSVDWLIFRQHRNQPIGIAGLVEIQFAHRRAEFMIGLPNPQDRAAGTGLEATLLVMDYAFNAVGLNKLTTFVYGDNSASKKSTLALGFVQESILREHISIGADGGHLDLFGFGMTCRDFRDNARLARLSARLLGRDITVASARLQ
jgi:diamine N-acetyltransferase